MQELQKKYSKIAVKALFRSGDRVLYYKTKKGVRDLPGGHLHFGETLLSALLRELEEEIGFHFENEPPLVHAWTYLSSDGERHHVYVGYLFDLPEQTPFRSREFGDSIEYIWLDKNRIKEESFLPGMEEALLKAAAHQ